MQQRVWIKRLFAGAILYLTGYMLVHNVSAQATGWEQAIKILGYVIILISIVYNSIFLYRFFKESRKTN
ncbi:hypothetical protein [Flavobacterium akiainvivens]|uniref:hypothetical protein n=1 Tax=Flavobacterium akiainvivens TaxID=1202724 RepID=UPI0008E83638|nr:hypothetical protein [Flavobacterium akiainvivens]SFQ53515.1 hypothetical protein SAMN05444144_10735 [Flavobacterium akiainvivens]